MLKLSVYLPWKGPAVYLKALLVTFLFYFILFLVAGCSEKSTNKTLNHPTHRILSFWDNRAGVASPVSKYASHSRLLRTQGAAKRVDLPQGRVLRASLMGGAQHEEPFSTLHSPFQLCFPSSRSAADHSHHFTWFNRDSSLPLVSEVIGSSIFWTQQ